jgi:hypothetical protein
MNKNAFLLTSLQLFIVSGMYTTHLTAATITVQNKTGIDVTLWEHYGAGGTTSQNTLNGQSPTIAANSTITCQVPDDVSYAFTLYPANPAQAVPNLPQTPTYSPRSYNWIRNAQLNMQKALYFNRDASTGYYYITYAYAKDPSSDD